MLCAIGLDMLYRRANNKLFSDGFQREQLTQDIPIPHDERTETKNSDRTGKKNSNSNCKNRTERREAQLRANLVTCKRTKNRVNRSFLLSCALLDIQRIDDDIIDN